MYGISSVTTSATGAAAAVRLAFVGRRSCPHSWQKFSLHSLAVPQLGQVTAVAAAPASGIAAATTGAAAIVVVVVVAGFGGAGGGRGGGRRRGAPPGGGG